MHSSHSHKDSADHQLIWIPFSVTPKALVPYHMHRNYILYLFFPVSTVSSSFVLFTWSQHVEFSLIHFLPYGICYRSIEHYWFAVLLWYNLDSWSSLSFCVSWLSPLCTRVSFRVLWPGLCWGLSLPEWCRLWSYQRPVRLPNRLHWDELWAELSRPCTFQLWADECVCFINTLAPKC